MSLVIAIDGPAASGKGTLARRLAKHYHLPHLDTGLLYRAVAWAALQQKLDLKNEEAVAKAATNLAIGAMPEEELRSAQVSEAASVVSVHPKVRQALLDLQRHFAHTPLGAVLDGRDIGTVICPDADIKFFITASPEIRADRRFKEAQKRGEIVEYETILADIRKRDERDSARSAAPLKQAEDALLIDTSAMGIDEVMATAISAVERMLEERKTKKAI